MARNTTAGKRRAAKYGDGDGGRGGNSGVFASVRHAGVDPLDNFVDRTFKPSSSSGALRDRTAADGVVGGP